MAGEAGEAGEASETGKAGEAGEGRCSNGNSCAPKWNRISADGIGCISFSHWLASRAS